MINLKGKDLVWLHDWSKEEIETILDTAHIMKSNFYAGIRPTPLTGKSLAMLFSKHSTRTRVSFEVAMTQLGGHAVFLGKNDIQMGRGETVEDTARILAGFCDAIMIRTFAQNDVVTLAEYAKVPVINGLTDLVHPVQALADLLTIKEKFGKLEGIVLTYVGDGNNVVHSLMLGGAKMGLEVRSVSPEGYKPNKDIVEMAKKAAQEYGGKITVTTDINDGLKGSDVVYTDVWTSMGQEEEAERRVNDLKDYQVNGKLMAKAKPTAMFMHCLPAHRGEEVTADVVDGPRSIIFDQAENRLHVQKALLALVM
jgi:ornithine carbamoyltransferase